VLPNGTGLRHLLGINQRIAPADTGIFVESGVSLTLVSGIAGVADLLGTPPKPIGENQAAVGNRGSRARWPDLTQTLQPLRPAVACSLAPAGSLRAR
jgi:hypothetical protein